MKNAFRSLAIAASTCIALCSMWAINQSENEIATRLQVNPEIVQLGTVDQDSKHDIQVTLTNRSADLILIDDVISGCGCAIADITKRPLLPGEFANLNIQWSVGKRRYDSGVDVLIKYHQQKANNLSSATVSDSTGTKILTMETWVPIRAHVRPSLEVQPRELTFPTQGAVPWQSPLSIKPKDPSIIVQNVVPLHPSLSVTVASHSSNTSKDSNEGSTVHYIVHFNPSKVSTPLDRLALQIIGSSNSEGHVVVPVVFHPERANTNHVQASGSQ